MAGRRQTDLISESRSMDSAELSVARNLGVPVPAQRSSSNLYLDLVDGFCPWPPDGHDLNCSILCRSFEERSKTRGGSKWRRWSSNW